MSKMELEIKILNTNKEKLIERLKELNAKFVSEDKQYLYTYDTPTIYGRYVDILTQLNFPESQIKYETAISKLKLLFFDLENLLTCDEKKDLEIITQKNKLEDIILSSDILKILNEKELIDYISKYHNNSKKWIRLRKTGDKTTIAVKHILTDNDSCFQQMKETKIETSNIKEANLFLEALGFSYKSYQEKLRLHIY